MFYRANNRKGYLLTQVLSVDAAQMELEDVEYYNPAVPSESFKDRNIPMVAGELIVLAIWAAQYPAPSADPNRELVVAEWIPDTAPTYVNDFSADVNCKALWKLDDGALTVDSKETNTLTNDGVLVNTSDYKEGDASGQFAVGDFMEIIDDDLVSGFPLKSDDTKKEISTTFWVKFDYVVGLGGFETVHAKYISTSGKRSIAYGIYNLDGVTTFVFLHGYNNGDNGKYYFSTVPVVTGVWYHVGYTYRDSDKSWKIRVWDDTNETVSEDTGNTDDYISISDVQVRIGVLYNWLQGLVDEIVVFNDILTSDEIDDIRQKLYGYNEVLGYYAIQRGQEGTEAGIHYVGDNVAGVYSAAMSREILIFEDLRAAIAGSIGYTEDVRSDSDMELLPLVPDNEVSDPEGYMKILCCAGPGEAPFWQFAWADEIGAFRAVL